MAISGNVDRDWHIHYSKAQRTILACISFIFLLTIYRRLVYIGKHNSDMVISYYSR